MWGVGSAKLCVLMTFIIASSRIVGGRVQVTSSNSGTNRTEFLDSSVTFTWNFTGKLFAALWGTKKKGSPDIEDNLLTLSTSGQQSFDVPLYNGRVSGSWNSTSSNQVRFTLSDIREEDNRIFIFQFHPQDALSSQVVRMVQLIVQGFPKATVVPPLLSIGTGVGATFACNTSGFPVPDVKWKRRTGSSEIEIEADNRKYQVSFRSGYSEFIIKNATVDDLGYYICEASNFKSDAATAYLGVTSFYKDDDLCPKSIDATIGESRTICCPFKGYPPPDILWQVPNGTFRDSGDITLPIVLKTDNDFGGYKCLARSLEEEVEHVVTIRKKVSLPTIVTHNVTELKAGDKFMWEKVPKALEYLLRISETNFTKAISLLGGSVTSVEIPYSSLPFKSKNVHERPRKVNVNIEVEAIGERGRSWKRDRYKVVIYARATTFTVSSMTLFLSFVVYNLQ